MFDRKNRCSYNAGDNLSTLNDIYGAGVQSQKVAPRKSKKVILRIKAGNKEA
jgi:hypothetical protein